MAKTKTEKQIKQRMVSESDSGKYVHEGWKVIKKIGSSSVLIEKAIDVVVEVLETELETITRQIKELQARKDILEKAGKEKK